MAKTILITGGCGFVGSSLAIAFKNKYPDYKIIALDNLKRRGSELNISRLKDNGIDFVHGDIRNKEDIEIFDDLDLIIEAAAEPSVMAGINSSPDYLINSNLLGTINCLNIARKHNAGFLYLSTSRVYPIKDINSIHYEETETRFNIAADQTVPGVSISGISEKFPIENARSLYGSSKLASELFIKEFAEMYGLKTIINRCGVLTGPWQMGKVDQGFVVLWLSKHLWKGDLGYFGFEGKGKQVRDILHVNDLFKLIDYQVHNIEKLSGETYNVGGGPSVSTSLCELTDICARITGNKLDIEEIKENRQADIRIYITDNEKVTNATGWVPTTSVENIMEEIYSWLIENEKVLKPILQ